jgi:hypothetical protein
VRRNNLSFRANRKARKGWVAPSEAMDRVGQRVRQKQAKANATPKIPSSQRKESKCRSKASPASLLKRAAVAMRTMTVRENLRPRSFSG